MWPESEARIISPLTIIPFNNNPEGLTSRIITEPSDNSWSTSVSATRDRGPSIPTSHIWDPLPKNSTGISIVDDSTVGMLPLNVDSMGILPRISNSCRISKSVPCAHEIVPVINPITPWTPLEENLI
ncbi:MAG: hypothetical protein CMB59_03600 [Euryarchaeota archaeon]|nr:hypothetical protein [Euryarchaeota archaeon]